MRVRCYYNLTKKTFSVIDTATGRITFHSNQIYLTDAKFQVRQAGRNRVLKEQQKNVHAFVTGTWSNEFDTTNMIEATYNPYKYESFVIKETEKPVYQAYRVLLENKQVFFA